MDLTVNNFEITSLALQYCGLDPSQQLSGPERRAVTQAEQLVRLYLMRTSIEQKYTNSEQADALGISVSTVKRLASSEEFAKVSAFMAPASRSPVMGEAKNYLQEVLLPAALRGAQALLDDPETRSSTKANMIGQIMKYAFQQQEGDSSEVQRRDAMEFLRQQGAQVVNIGQVVVNQNLAPSDYVEKLRESMPDFVEGEATEVIDGPAVE
jgi:methanogenic corrinoid protein MtbC1